MHILQEKILNLAKKRNLASLNLRQLGDIIGEEHPQKVKHHLNQLIKIGLLKHADNGKTIEIVNVDSKVEDGIIAIPILGSANCGAAEIFAEENLEGYLRVSKRLLSKTKGLFALRASGNSMNKALIKNKHVDNGDFIIIDSEDTSPKDKDYILSVIDGVCNIKKYINDRPNKQIVLLSESTENYSPIYIHPDDENYLINGKVIEVIKKPQYA
jgi:SOS-response transcriptional repressor LexA